MPDYKDALGKLGRDIESSTEKSVKASLKDAKNEKKKAEQRLEAATLLQELSRLLNHTKIAIGEINVLEEYKARFSQIIPDYINDKYNTLDAKHKEENANYKKICNDVSEEINRVTKLMGKVRELKLVLEKESTLEERIHRIDNHEKSIFNDKLIKAKSQKQKFLDNSIKDMRHTLKLKNY